MNRQFMAILQVSFVVEAPTEDDAIDIALHKGIWEIGIQSDFSVLCEELENDNDRT